MFIFHIIKYICVIYYIYYDAIRSAGIYDFYHIKINDGITTQNRFTIKKLLNKKK